MLFGRAEYERLDPSPTLHTQRRDGDANEATVDMVVGLLLLLYAVAVPRKTHRHFIGCLLKKPGNSTSKNDPKSQKMAGRRSNDTRRYRDNATLPSK